MNCKPGDLARVVNDGPFRDRFIIVTVCEVTDHGPIWYYEGEPLLLPGGRQRQVAFFDRVLRPVRDPGDDARDETLDWLPVPKVSALDPEFMAQFMEAALEFYRERG